MANDRLICGMWGTTNLRLFLVEDGRLLEVREGPGASQLEEDEFERTLADLTQDWRAQPLSRDILLGGMVGSTIGWSEAPYIACPLDIVQPPQTTTINCGLGPVHIVCGLSTTNMFGEPDVMRGEEVELLGLAEFFPEIRQGQHIICIPGTHAKWVLVKDGAVENFVTSVAGELFAGLISNGILVPQAQKSEGGNTDAFKRGIEHAISERGSLLHLLFSVRARQVISKQGDGPRDALDRLSGLIIGSDVATLLHRPEFSGSQNSVFVIGNGQVTDRYAYAIEAHGLSTTPVRSQDLSIAGFWAISERLKSGAVAPALSAPASMGTM